MEKQWGWQVHQPNYKVASECKVNRPHSWVSMDQRNGQIPTEARHMSATSWQSECNGKQKQNNNKKQTNYNPDFTSEVILG